MKIEFITLPWSFLTTFARKRITELSKGVGKPKVGGPLTGFVDQHKKIRTEDEFLGKFRLVSLGRPVNDRVLERGLY